MRPIDGDVLKELFVQVLENIKSNPRMTGQEMHIITAIHTVGQMIDDAPTIDAIPISWIKERIENAINAKQTLIAQMWLELIDGYVRETNDHKG